MTVLHSTSLRQVLVLGVDHCEHLWKGLLPNIDGEVEPSRYPFWRPTLAGTATYKAVYTAHSSRYILWTILALKSCTKWKLRVRFEWHKNSYVLSKAKQFLHHAVKFCSWPWSQGLFLPFWFWSYICNVLIYHVARTWVEAPVHPKILYHVWILFFYKLTFFYRKNIYIEFYL